MNRYKNIGIALAVVLLTAQGVMADWMLGDPYKMHYPQLPDLSPLGVDVLDGPRLAVDTSGNMDYYEKCLADDWLCTGSGAVTGIHIWGSYRQDVTISPANPYFTLAIYKDVPAGTDNIPYSRPGALLWQTYTQADAVRKVASGIQETFYDPNPDAIIGRDSVVYQFNFDIPAANAFVQKAGQVYWLAVQYTNDVNLDGVVDGADIAWLAQQDPGLFGWKTTPRGYLDSAVWTDNTRFNLGIGKHSPPLDFAPGTGLTIWNTLDYPANHPLAGQSMDLSFVIVPEPMTPVLLGLGSLTVLRKKRRSLSAA